MKRWLQPGIVLSGLLVVVGLLAGLGHVPTASSQTPGLTAVRVVEQPPLDPDFRLWAKIPGLDVPLTAQNLVYPNGGGTIDSVDLKSIEYGDTLYIRASWKVATPSTGAGNAEAFSDAVALEFPAKSAVNVPSFCMGQADSGVNIWQWRADSQAGGPDDVVIRTFPNSATDTYSDKLADDPIYQPARALGNPVARFGDHAVQNLEAQAFGALSPAEDQSVQGFGSWKDGRWSVVFARPFKGGTPNQAEFSTGTSTNMAVAAWNGSHGDRGGQKQVSQFVTLNVSGSHLREAVAQDWSTLWLGSVLGGGALITGLALLAWMGISMSRQRGKRG